MPLGVVFGVAGAATSNLRSGSTLGAGACEVHIHNGGDRDYSQSGPSEMRLAGGSNPIL